MAKMKRTGQQKAEKTIENYKKALEKKQKEVGVGSTVRRNNLK